MTFSGVVTWKNYNWGYECVHCGKKVEKSAAVSASVGQNHKSTSYVYVTSEGEREMIRQAELDLSTKCDVFAKKVESGNFFPPENDGGVCPFCKKYQHWASSVKTDGNKSPLRSTVSNIFLSAFVSISGSFVLLLVIQVIGAIVSDSFSIGSYFLTAFSCLFIIGFTLLMVVLTRISAQVRADSAALKGLEKKAPYFLSWGEAGHNSTGLTVR